MAHAFVDLEGISLAYGDTLAVAGCSLHVERGEFAALLGTSGCGKSPLLKVVSGLVPPTAGHAVVDGREVKGPRGGIGIAFQNVTPWTPRSTRC